MNELEELLYGESETAEEFLVREEQVNRQGRVNLDQDSVFRVADEGLYAQILFDFLEEELDLPAVFIDVGDGFRRKPEMVGQKFVVFPGFLVPIRRKRKDFPRLETSMM